MSNSESHMTDKEYQRRKYELTNEHNRHIHALREVIRELNRRHAKDLHDLECEYKYGTPLQVGDTVVVIRAHNVWVDENMAKLPPDVTYVPPGSPLEVQRIHDDVVTLVADDTGLVRVLKKFVRRVATDLHAPR